ncbi:MAG: hypothetical protein M3439_00365 [Chloroflexota bacterium]|nr:hypothetical protein [Chloroflexota bacterium]
MDTFIEDRRSDDGGPILLLIPDVFFAVTVRNTVRRIGYDPHILKTTDDIVVAAGEHRAVLGVVDLAAVKSASEWTDIGVLVVDGLPVLVFGSHKDVDGLRAAKSAGVTRVVSNGQFHREMADLIQRYALAPSCIVAEEESDIETPLGSMPPGMAEHLPDHEPVKAVIGK